MLTHLAALLARLLFTADLRVFRGGFHALRRDEAIPAGADQILAAGLAQRLADEREVLRALELQQR